MKIIIKHKLEDGSYRIVTIDTAEVTNVTVTCDDEPILYNIHYTKIFGQSWCLKGPVCITYTKPREYSEEWVSNQDSDIMKILTGKDVTYDMTYNEYVYINDAVIVDDQEYIGNSVTAMRLLYNDLHARVTMEQLLNENNNKA